MAQKGAIPLIPIKGISGIAPKYVIEHQVALDAEKHIIITFCVLHKSA
jgi:hypothetical protein